MSWAGVEGCGWRWGAGIMQLAVTGKSFWELGAWLEAEGQTPSSGLLKTQPAGWNCLPHLAHPS